MNNSQSFNNIQSLNMFARVLYVGMHPGDEDTQLLAYLSKHKHCDIGYLSLTRGEEMANYAGYEKGIDLGIIHTQELSNAAKIAGFEPLITCAMDLGNYPSTKEIFGVWDEDLIMSNLVWAIRYFRPDIIITPYNNDKDSAGGILASLIIEANKRASNKDYNSIQLAGRFNFLDTVSAKQIFWDVPDSLQINRNDCIPVYTNQTDESSGITYNEIAKQAYLCERSVFKDLGNLPLRKDTQYLKPLLSSSKSLFENIDTSWSRTGNDFHNEVDSIAAQFDFLHPEKSLKNLTDLYQQINQSGIDNFWKKIKLQQLQNIILCCAGISTEAFCDKPFGVLGQDYDFSVSVKNNLSDIKISNLHINDSIYQFDTSLAAKSNYLFTKKFHLSLDDNAYQPFWLNKPIRTTQSYRIDDSMTDKLIDTACYSATFTLIVNNLPLTIKTPLVYHTFDRMNGDIVEPFYAVEPVLVSQQPLVLLTNVTGDTKANKNTDINLKFRTMFSGTMFTIVEIQKLGKISTKNGQATTSDIPEYLYRSDTTVSFKPNDVFKIKIPFKDNDVQKNVAKTKSLIPSVLMNFSGNGESFDSNIKEINYNYIPNVLYNYHDETTVVNDEIKTKGKHVAYLFGLPDDALNNALYQLGYKTDDVSMEKLNLDSLKNYDAIIIGNYLPKEDLDTNVLKTTQFNLENYVYKGGTLISFANDDELNFLLPHSITTASQSIIKNPLALKFVAAGDSSLFSYPNKIDINSIANWNNQLAYGFALQYDNHFQPALKIQSLKDNSFVAPILYTHDGNGIAIYCNLDIPSQALNAQPDAFKLLANFIAFVHHNNNGNH
ncbi:hypothetical protein A9P82_09055 [Arachidicoccus ginsenosidimutans]|uniref:PIG-L family deacetylase n=1 Tax=Arachidicoccus sp. BS20 TaxID=1850526 RepID=UPI0007F0A020|nr:PIG-L family deacetylase [Arachidicoccus sp. BS20]ANI89430.1 hypothetical protein A9P82_09055 [Arachidicoccus sp. BS20]